ncbi:MAG TPA: hypothetical protein VGL56_18465 [Fimbriimonadaceae bacterium]|jgi:hypothetical protein
MPFFQALLLLAAFSSQGKTPVENWREYPIGKNFRLSFPEKPFKAPDKTQDSTTVTWIASANDSADTVVLAQTSKKDPNPEETRTEIIRDSCDNDFDRLLAQSETTFNGWPELDLTCLDSEGGAADLRFIETTYGFLSMDTTYNGNEGRPQSSTRFLRSLKATDSLPKGPSSQVGPTLKEYKLGDSGISAKFPHEPEHGAQGTPFDEGNALNQGEFRLAGLQTKKPKAIVPPGGLQFYTASYLDQFFAAAYMHIPPAALNEIGSSGQFLKAAVQELEDSTKAKGVESTLGKIGAQDALWFKCILEGGFRMQGVVLIHKNQVVMTMAVCPKIFLHSPLEKEFLDSLKFSD